MSVEHVEVLVEEPSMEEALQVLLPGVLGDRTFEIHPFRCKTDLLEQLPKRMKGYSSWLPEGWRIVVVVDRDQDDCAKLKAKLEKAALDAGFPTRSRRRGGSFKVVNRVAIEELEAWFFGDWQAVQAAYPGVAATLPANAGFRDPDAIRGGTWEALERALQKAGHHAGGLRKREAARAIAANMQPDRSQSRSFQVFHAALKELAGEAASP